MLFPICAVFSPENQVTNERSQQCENPPMKMAKGCGEPTKKLGKKRQRRGVKSAEKKKERIRRRKRNKRWAKRRTSDWYSDEW